MNILASVLQVTGLRVTGSRAFVLGRRDSACAARAGRPSLVATAIGFALFAVSSAFAQSPPPGSPLQKRMALIKRASNNPNLSDFTAPSANAATAEYVDIYGDYAYGINDWGVTVGEYCYAAAACTQAVNGTGPFLFEHGNYTTPAFPAAVLGAYPSGINLLGQVVGLYFDASFTIHGFVLQGSKFRSIDAPGTSPSGFFGTYTNGINTQGDIVGQYFDHNNNAHDFVIKDGVFKPFTLPITESVYDSPNGINDFGDIVGYFQDNLGKEHGYLLSHGVANVIDFPGAQSTQAWGINLEGDIVGSYTVPVTTNPYSSTYYYGFLLHRGSFATINPPGGSSAFDGANTAALGINDLGEIVGYYQRATGTGSAQLTGFLRKW
jgi:uncharacterized membrane protein